MTYKEASDGNFGCKMWFSFGSASEQARFECTYATGHVCSGEIVTSDPHLMGDSVECPPVLAKSLEEVKQFYGDNFSPQGLCSLWFVLWPGHVMWFGTELWNPFMFPPPKEDPEDDAWDSSKHSCYGFVDTEPVDEDIESISARNGSRIEGGAGPVTEGRARARIRASVGATL